jgi:RND family efflux transporter MFP subunit
MAQMSEETFWGKIWKFIKKPWTLVVIGVAVVVLVIVIFSGNGGTPADVITVVRGNISEEVSATGTVKPVKSADLAFEKSGRVSAVLADVGDRVYAGEPLVMLEKGDLAAQLSKAEADLEAQKADLEKAKVDLANYFGGIPDILNDAYAKAEDAVRKQLDALFTNDELQNVALSFSTRDISVDNDMRALRIAASVSLNQWLKELGAVKNTDSQEIMDGYMGNALDRLSVVRSLLLKAMDAVTNATDTSLSSSSADTYKANINTGRTNVNTAISNINTRKQSIVSEKSAIISLGADIKSYEASVENIKAQIGKMTIYAPISGVVTVQNGKTGEIAAAGSLLVSVISANRFEIEANVAEADIAKVKVGDLVRITLDAYGNDEVFDAKVSFIDPAETMVEGVATYRTKFQFLKDDERIRSGMTANVTIFTDKREGVLVVPQRVITTKDGIKTVLLDMGDGRSEEKVVETGLRGADGNVEIINGLSEGDRVIVGSSF